MPLELPPPLETTTPEPIIINRMLDSSTYQRPQPLRTDAAELFIPARTLDYGIYQLQITVSMVAAPHLISVASTYVQIIPSAITPNLLPFGTSMIVHGRGGDLLLDPGTHSLDPDALSFDGSVSARSLCQMNEWSDLVSR